VITAVNRHAIGSVAEFEEAVRAADEAILLNITRGTAALFIVIR
jgi:hypothetical protein